ncbi:ABC transporter substrate-binding protein [Candidatus Pacearchaeota archaeon]|nr:ABC transporter substrate-binding protein [Candidatus Pacearchaeota archaeon]
MKKRNKFIVIGIIVLVMVIITGIWYNTSHQKDGTIKIGATLALSGKYTYIGQQELNGLIMAAEEINNNGGINGRKLQVIAEDNKGDATEAVNNINKLINVDNSEVIFSAFTHVTNAIKKTVFDNKKILFYASTIPDIARENKYAFRDYYDATDNGKAIADVVNQQGHKKVAFLTEVSDQCIQYEQGFLEEASKLGINVTTREQYQTTETDLKTNLLKLNLKNVDALVVCSWRHEPILMKQLKELNSINVPTFHWVALLLPASDTLEMRQLFEENGAISSWYGLSEVPDKKIQVNFIEKYKQKYNILPTADAVYTYDDLYVITNALKTCKGKIGDKDCIATQILSIKYDGVGGYLKFDTDGVSKRDVLLIKVVNAKWEELN